MDLRKGTVIECVASTPDKDVSGEILDIGGADLSPIHEQRGYFNSDHRNDFAHTVGRVMDAKKIMKAEDCETPTQLKYWNELRKPFIWARGELFDGHGHKEADAIASVYKFYMAKNEAPPVKISVEGKTLERSGNVLKRTLIKNLAITLQPCNRNTKTEVVELVKNSGVEVDSLMKSEDAFVPSFVELKEDPFQKVYQLAVTARELLKDVRQSLTKSDEDTKVELKSPAMLKRIKEMTASLRKTRK